MKLNRNEIISKEEVGTDHLGNKIVHIRTLGGCHLICSVDPYGAVNILGTGAHRAFAKNASQSRAVIAWNQDSNLFKNEEMSELQAKHHESTPHSHFQLAAYFSKKLGKQRQTDNPSFEDKLLMTMFQDAALRHYEMAGFSKKNAKVENEKQMNYHSEVDDSYNPPYDDQMLTNSFNSKNIEKSEDLEKDRGRITFPADPKITNRPDSMVKEVNKENDNSVKVNAKRIINVLNPDKKSIPSGSLENKIKDPSSHGITAESLISTHDAKAMSTSGRNPTIEHEGGHYLFKEIARKHGNSVKNKFIDHLISGMHPEAYKAIDSFLKSPQSGASYKALESKDPYRYKEEVLNHLRDSLVGKKYGIGKRKDVNPNNSRDLDGKLKQSWESVKRISGDFNMPVHKSETNFSITQGELDYFSPEFELETEGSFLHTSESLKKAEEEYKTKQALKTVLELTDRLSKKKVE